jgi:hypothetical protein
VKIRTAALTFALLVGLGSPAIANDDDPDVSVDAEDNGLSALADQTDLGAGAPDPSGGITEVSDLPPRDSGLDAICVATAIAVGEEPFSFCDLPPEAAEELLTPDVVLAAFRRIPLPAHTPRIQPPNGRTLVNFATNFYTDADTFDRTITLLGQRIDLRITPAEFTWHHGDGTTHTSTDPGARYPDLRITHTYQRKGKVAPSLEVTYTAIYRVNGGGWRDVSGTVTIPGPTVDLTVLTATPTLVGSD